jgi:SAM-dependent methyltransferase
MANHKTFSYLFLLLLPVIAFGQKIKSNDSTFQVNEEPNVLLMETVKRLIAGKALDLGMELGRNSIYLAMNGWEVTGVDMADETSTLGLMEASKNKVNIAALERPIQSYDIGINEWDLIVHVYKGCFNDSRISRISKALKPGGILVFEFFHREAGVEMKKPTYGCETNSIKRTIEQVGEFNILSYAEETALADYGWKNYKLVKLVASKK